MKHRIADDVNVNVNIDIPAQDLEDLIDKVTDSAIVLIAAVTAAHILKSLFSKEPS